MDEGGATVFELDEESVKEMIPNIAQWSSSLSYDIASAAGRQKSFFYQVSLPHYRQRSFQLQAVERYRRYLYLKKLNRPTFLVPCYDMDLMWHTHQVHPHRYANDTMAILDGMILPHDDSVNDRSDGSKLNASYETTVKLWKRAFGDKTTVLQAGGHVSRRPAQWQVDRVGGAGPNVEKGDVFAK